MGVKLQSALGGSVELNAPSTASNFTMTAPSANGQLYTNQTILGTVSQSSGVPTGAIIERGSNANGEFVRFADGTQIVTRTVTQTSGDNAGTTFSYAATFPFGAPVVVAITNSVASGGVGGSFVTEAGAVGTADARVKTLVHTPTEVINPVTNTPIMVVLVGRWF